MQAHAALRDAAGVEKSFRNLARVLRHELGMDPAPETERRYRILSGRA